MKANCAENFNLSKKQFEDIINLKNDPRKAFPLHNCLMKPSIITAENRLRRKFAKTQHFIKLSELLSRPQPFLKEKNFSFALNCYLFPRRSLLVVVVEVFLST